MELHRIERATPPSEESGEAEYWIGVVRPCEDMFGFEVLDYSKHMIAQFLFADEKSAQIARERMFGVLENVVAIAVIEQN